MRLSECLNSSDINILRRIAEAYDFDCSKSSKNALMQEIITHFHNRRFVADAYSSIREHAFREAVTQLMLDSRSEFSKEEVLALVRRAGQTKEGMDVRWMNRLQKEGWLFRLNSKGGRQFYFIPDDLRKTMRDFLADHLKQRVQAADQDPIVYRDEQLAMIRDTAVFLTFVEKNDVPITKDGTIMKRQQAQLLALFEIKEEPLGKVSWRFGYGRRFHDYPDRFALIYDYCFNRELIKETQEGQLLLTPKAHSWLQKGEKERAADLFRFWRLLYRRPIPKLRVCVATLSQAAKDQWVHVSSMNSLLAPYVKDYYYDKARTVMELRIYHMLVHQGLLAHGQLADGTPVIKLTALGREILLDEAADEAETEAEAAEQEQHQARTPLILQPNFDLLIPLEEFARLEWELDEVTELIRVDTMRVHRLTKTSVFNAFENGWTGETVLDFLREETGDMVPGNVERMIGQWAAEYGRIRLYRAVLVECREELMAADLKKIPELKPHLRLDLTGTHFLIGEEGVPILQEHIAKMGYQAEILG